MEANATSNATKLCFHELGNLEVPDEKWELGVFFNLSSVPSNISYFCEETEDCCPSFTCCKHSGGSSLLAWSVIIVCFTFLFAMLFLLCRRKSRGCRGFLFTLQNWSYIHRQGRADPSYPMAQMRENPFTVM